MSLLANTYIHTLMEIKYVHIKSLVLPRVFQVCTIENLKKKKFHERGQFPELAIQAHNVLLKIDSHAMAIQRNFHKLLLV